MNEELSELLTDLFIGATFDGEEVLGTDFTRYNDGNVMLNIRCTSHQLYMQEEWHHILVPSAGIQVVQDRLASVPSVSSAERLEAPAQG